MLIRNNLVIPNLNLNLSLNLNSKILLSPMCGVTDLPFRTIARKLGCRFAFTEMVDAIGLNYKSKSTIKLLKTNDEDKPLAVQLVGKDPDTVLNAAQLIEDNFEFIDFNSACPARKVTSSGKGATLLKNPSLLQSILEKLTKNLKKPVTVKIRTGWDEKTVNAIEIAKLVEGCGVAAIFIHGRHREQMYRGEIDFQTIAQVKQTVKIPVIASGNIWGPVEAKKMFDETGCDGIVVARGAMGNPWVFEEIRRYLETGDIGRSPSAEEIKSVMLEHIKLNIEFCGNELRGISRLRKLFPGYLKRLLDTISAAGGNEILSQLSFREIKIKFMLAKTVAEISNLLNSLF